MTSEQDNHQQEQQQEEDDTLSSFSMLSHLPLEITENILYHYLSGKALSTLALALQRSYVKNKINQSNNDTAVILQRVSDLIGKVAKKRLLTIADSLELAATRMDDAAAAASSADNNNDNSNHTNTAGNTTTNNDTVLTRHAVNWIRSVTNFSFLDESHAKMRVTSENLALVDFLEWSLDRFSRPNLAQFEWPVWCGQITVDSFSGNFTRMRNTASVVLTAPMQSPSFIPGCNLIHNHAPSGIFKSEPYNMMPVPPWGKVRALTWEDAHVLRPLAGRLERLGQVAVPSQYHNDEILDIRVISSSRARELLAQLSWQPRSKWILQDVMEDEEEGQQAEGNNNNGDDETANNNIHDYNTFEQQQQQQYAQSLSSSLQQPTAPQPLHQQWKHQQQPAAAAKQYIETGLVCVWQEDTMEMRSDRQYVAYIIDLMKALDRIQT